LAIRFGSGALQFELVEGWQKRPGGWPLEDIAAVCTDSDDNVYLYGRRGEQPVSVYDRAGNFLRSWGAGEFSRRSHGMFMTSTDELFLVDDGLNFVRRFSLDGELLQTIGPAGVRSDSGYRDNDAKTITRGAPPYNSPTNVTVAGTGDIYVSDGYRNAAVHRFDATGEYLQTWGGPGTGPGEFRTPHGIAVDAGGRVFVADRENDRVQIFSADGVYLEEWTDIRRPQDIFIDGDGLVYVAELSWFVGEESFRLGPIHEYLPARLSIFDPQGNLLLRWSDPDPTKDGYFTSPHGIWLDSEGSIYLAEVTEIWAVERGHASVTDHRFQKFARL
jgi:sugar lactone lactonase YvrE